MQHGAIGQNPPHSRHLEGGAGRAQAAEVRMAHVVFKHHPLEQMSSDYVPDVGKVTRRLSCALARGEYDCVQFGVHSLGELTGIRVSATSDLRRKIVKKGGCWLVSSGDRD